MINPHDNSDRLGWETFEVEYGEPSYSFNTLQFWKTKTGDVFMAYDYGCSCPTPFEMYEAETEEGVKELLTRVVSLDQVEEEFRRHGRFDWLKPNISWGELRAELIDWGVAR